MHTSLISTAIALFCLLLGACQQGTEPQSSHEVAARGLHSAAFSRDAKHLVIGSIYHGGSLWQSQPAERLYDWNHRPDESTTIIAADFSPDGDYVITADPHTLVLWQTADGQALRYWSAPAEILDLALSPKGHYALLGTSDHRALMFDAINGGIKRTFSHKNRVRSVDLSANGRLALTGSEDQRAVLWDTSAGKALFSQQHNDEVQLVKLSNDGSIALSASKYDEVRLWTTADGALLGRLPFTKARLKRGLRVTAAVFSADNRWLLTGLPDSEIRLWDVSSLREVARWRLPTREKWKPTGASVLALAFSEQEGIYYAVSANGFLHTLQRPPKQ